MRGLSGSAALATAAGGLTVLLLAGLLALRPSQDGPWGDEGTFVAMTASLVRDRDLVFDEADLAWVRQRSPESPVTVILQRTERGITYSKPPLYPLLASPLFATMGESGLIAANLLALSLSLFIAWRHLSSLAPNRRAMWTLAVFACCSVLPLYIGWKMSDLVQAASALAGLTLTLGGLRAERFGSPWAAIGGGALLGAAIGMRLTAAALVLVAVAALLLYRRLLRALLVGGVAVLVFLIAGATSYWLLGTANPYKAVRTSFNHTTGYPAGAEMERALERFSSQPATQSATWRPPFDARLTAYSALYFLLGRHSGVLIYFPLALVLVLQILRRPDRLGVAMVFGAVMIIGFYLVWMPHNYFGGSTFLGNRYFLGVYPALLVGLRTLPSARWLAAAWALSIVAMGSALVSVGQVREIDQTSQSHTRAGLFRLLPFESTAQRIDGVAERFWADDHLRFVDPYTRPARWSFRLDSRRPATELVVATEWPGETLLFVVAAGGGEVTLEIRDWRGRPLPAGPSESSTARGLLVVRTSPAWRVHPFWWKQGKLYRARSLRLALSSSTGEPATAVVRYAGRGRELSPLSARLLGSALPSAALAGSSSQIVVRAQNTGRRPWESDALLPVKMSYRLRRVRDDQIVARRRLALPGKIHPGEILELPIEVQWPGEPDRFELELAILREPAGALGELGRHPLAATEVTVE